MRPSRDRKSSLSIRDPGRAAVGDAGEGWLNWLLPVLGMLALGVLLIWWFARDAESIRPTTTAPVAATTPPAATAPAPVSVGPALVKKTICAGQSVATSWLLDAGVCFEAEPCCLIARLDSAMKAAVAPPPSIAGSATSSLQSPWRFALPLIVATLLIGAIGAFAFRLLSDDIRDETHRTLAVIAEQKRQQLEAFLAESRLEAELHFSGNALLPMLLDQWLDGGRRDEALLARMQDRLDEVMRVHGWAGVAVLDAEARPLAVVGEVDAREQEALAREILSRPRIESVDLHRNARGEAEYGVLAPIGLPGAAPLGVAYLVWRTDRTLYPLVESWPVPTRTAETYLVRRDGDQVRFLTPLRHHPGAELALTRPLTLPDLPAARAAQGQRGIIAGGRDYRGIPVLAYAAAVAGTHWSMVAEIDESEAYAGIRGTAWATALVMGLTLLLLHSAGYALWRRELTALYARQAAEARFRFIFEQAPLGVVLVETRNGPIIQANRRFAAIAGCVPEELASLDWMRVIQPDDLRRVLDRLARLNAGEVSDFRSTARYLRPDGSVLWVNLTVTRMRIGTDRVHGYLAIVEDITERKQMEDQLRGSEEKYRSLVESTTDCIWELDAQGRFTYLSPRFQDLTGYSPEEFLGKPPLDLVGDDGNQSIRERALAALVDQQPVTGQQVPVRHRDGRRLIVEVSGIPLFGPEGDYSGMRGITRDITERKRLEGALTATESRFRLLFERHSAVMLLVDPVDGRILDANIAAAQFYGYSRNELQAMNVFQINCLSAEAVTSELNLARQEAKSCFIFPHRLADGTIRTVEIHSTPIALKDKPLLFSIIHDITERMKAQEALAQSEELMRLFIDRAPVALALFDGEMRYLAVSARWIQDYSLDGLEILGRSHYALFPEIPEHWKDVHRRGLAGEVIRAVEDRFERQDGTVQWIRWEVRPWSKGDGSAGGVLIFSEDITLRKQAEEALRLVLTERSRKEERKRLLQDMHDGFGSQLASARLRIERSELTTHEIQVLLRECLDDLQLVVDTASDEDKSLRDALVDYRYRCESRLSDQPVRIDWEIQLDDCPPLGQRVNLHILRILQEALNNALKHAQARHIGVQATYNSDDDLILAVTDDGIGLPVTLEPGRGTGNMQSRARNIGARLEWTRRDPGTRVSLAFHAGHHRVSHS